MAKERTHFGNKRDGIGRQPQQQLRRVMSHKRCRPRLSWWRLRLAYGQGPGLLNTQERHKGST